jgi:hypothetical protein
VQVVLSTSRLNATVTLAFGCRTLQ